MKTLIISMLALLGFSLLAPTAQAGDCRRYVQNYDPCGRPVYGYVHDNCRHRTYTRTSYRYYPPTRRVYYPTRYRYAVPPVRYRAPRPGVSIRFGF